MQDLIRSPAFWTLTLFLVPLMLKVPIAIALGSSAVMVAWYYGFGVMMLPYNFFANIVKFPLLAIPFFILAGVLMDKSGIAEKLVHFIRALVGNITGGLAIASIAVAVFWGAVSGVSAATVAALGVILIPGMVKAGYDKPFATAVIVVASGLAIVIPPSITFIIYAVITGVSVSRIFIAGIAPGFVIAAFLMLSAYVTCKKKGYGGEEASSWKEIACAFLDALWALVMPLIILGGIYGGVFTPTEAAVVAVMYALFVGTVVNKRLTLGMIYESLVVTLDATSVVMLVIACAGLFSWVGATVGLIQRASSLLLGLSDKPYMVLIAINVILFFAGMLLDGISVMYVFLPILMPIMRHFGWDPIWFGVMMTINLAIGGVTPPVAVNLYVGSKVSGLAIEEIVPPTIPLLAALLIALVVIAAFPSITLFLPRLLLP